MTQRDKCAAEGGLGWARWRGLFCNAFPLLLHPPSTRQRVVFDHSARRSEIRGWVCPRPPSPFALKKVVVDRKRIFVFLPKAIRGHRKKFPFCRNAERTERGYFCQKDLFLQKYTLSAKFLIMILAEVHQNACRNSVFLLKESISAERLHFCRKTERVQLNRKYFCQNWSPKIPK